LAEGNSNANDIWINLMKANKSTTSHFAICVDNSEYPASLELHKIYRVIPDKEAQKEGDLRVIDESGEDYLFPADYFVLVELPLVIVQALNKSFARSVQHSG
jgi:hypothetical protein